MIKKILDLHIHSKYSRACSKNLVLPEITKTCEIRGIDIVATGDFTHPAWFAHMKEQLVEDRDGIYRLRDNDTDIRFIIGTEISSIKKHAGETRRVHHLIFAPSLDVVQKFNTALEARGCNLRADGRPILGLTSKQILELMLEIDSRMVMIPAHAWTPWFGIFGSKGGYDSLEACFEDLTSHIFAIETGLSSDPLMNWRCSRLDAITLISNSDAHSLAKLGREANILQFDGESSVTYTEIMKILRTGDRNKFLSTIEFFPEEGKYHLDGHAPCGFSCEPNECNRLHGICPRCKKQMTVGVMHRVHELADRTEEEARQKARIPYKNLVPLPEIIADTLQIGVSTKGVGRMYEKLIHELGNEFFILIEAPLHGIARASTPAIAEAVRRVRHGEITIRPGYDGVFGVVKVFDEGDDRGGVKQRALLLD